MNLFKRKTIFWYLIYFLGILLAVWAYRISLRNDITSLWQFYQAELVDFIIIAMALPVFSGIILKKSAEYMNYSKMLNMGTRRRWLQKLMKELIVISMKYTCILLMPVNITAFLFSKNLRQISDILYCLFSYILYTAVFSIMAVFMAEIKIRRNMDIAAVSSAIIIALLPYVFTRILPGGQSLTFSEMINCFWLFQDGRYLWLMHEMICFAALLAAEILYKTIEYRIGKMDFLWRQNENEP